MAEVLGYHHVNLSVTDVEASVAWYTTVLGLVVRFRGEVDGMTKAVLTGPGGFLLGLTGHGSLASGDAFSERRTGLDHVALRVADVAGLEEWQRRLDALGIAHSGIKASVLGSLITVRDPDDVQLELFAPTAEGHPTEERSS